MSWEAWSDDDAGAYDHLLEAGWLAADDVEEIRGAVRDLAAEPVYEGGAKEHGISVRFLMRLTVLQDLVGLDVPPTLLAEAKLCLAAQQAQGRAGGGAVNVKRLANLSRLMRTAIWLKRHGDPGAGAGRLPARALARGCHRSARCAGGQGVSACGCDFPGTAMAMRCASARVSREGVAPGAEGMSRICLCACHSCGRSLPPSGRAGWLKRIGKALLDGTPLLALAALLAGCMPMPYYIVGYRTGIPVACWVTERTDTGFVCVDRYKQTWSCRWTPASKELDGECSPLGKVAGPEGGMP